MAYLLLSEIFPPKTGGSGRWFWEMYRRLPRSQVAIAAGADPRQEEFDRTHLLRLSRLPLTWPDFGFGSWSGLQRYLQAAWRVRRLMRAEGINQLHCARCVPCGWIGWLLKRCCRVRYTCYVHGEEVNIASAGDGSGVMASRQFRWMTQRVLRDAERVIANSRNTARILTRDWNLPAERVHLLYPGVDTRYFQPAPRDLAVRARLGWSDRPVVLTVGRLQKRKGQDQMILALHALRQRFPNVLYAIAGDGEERSALTALVERERLQEHVQFLGEVGDAALLQCYQQCDLFVLPNRQVGKDIEGFGMVLVEAQACGKPVIAGASGGTGETMRVPDTGLLVPCEESTELAQRVGELLADAALCERMGEAGREWVVSNFDWDAVTRRAERIFAGEALPAVDESQNRRMHELVAARESWEWR